MFLRALAAAALALLVGGDAARIGAAAFGPARLVFPYMWLFVLLESSRSRRRIGDGEVFLAGAAAAMLYAGVYTKDLQHGFHPLGVDWLGSLSALFDGGMIAVLALHALDRLRPRPEPVEAPEAASGLLLPVFLVFVLGGAVCVYGVKTAYNIYRADRMLGPTWLLADLSFAGVAWLLARRVRERWNEDADPDREPWIWALAGFGVWLPAARFIASLCAAFALPDPLLYFFAGSWTVACAFLSWRLWRERGHMETATVRGSRPALAAAHWRAAGALILFAIFGAGRADDRAAGAFVWLVEWPALLLFSWSFLTSRLKV